MKYVDQNGQLIYSSVVKTVTLAIWGIFFLFNLPFVTIGAGQVGVITQFGAVSRVVNPGINFKIPLIEQAVIMETRTQKEQVDAQAASRDLQEVKSTIALNFHLQGSKAVDVFQNTGVDYKERIIDPAMQESFKATTAKFTAEELIGKREQVKVIALHELEKRLTKYHVIVDDFNIVNFDFSQDFNNSIEQKQVAQQGLQQAKIEAETARTRAQGQSDAAKILKENGNLTPEYLEFFALQKWNGTLPNATNGVPFINIPTR